MISVTRLLYAPIAALPLMLGLKDTTAPHESHKTNVISPWP